VADTPGPMLARLADDLPVGAWSYEPKWDGFRCIAERRGGVVVLHSRHGRPLGRYFPEVVEAMADLGADATLDGEILVRGPGGDLDFPALLARMHPAASRVARLRRETPASFVAFDLLDAGGEPLLGAPFVARRAPLPILSLAPLLPPPAPGSRRSSRSRRRGCSSRRRRATWRSRDGGSPRRAGAGSTASSRSRTRRRTSPESG
jgi:hypothetical protein